MSLKNIGTQTNLKDVVLLCHRMRSVSVTSAGAFSDASAINGALKNLDSAIEQFDGEASSNCSSGLTVYRKPSTVVPVQIVVYEPPAQEEDKDVVDNGVRGSPPPPTDGGASISICDTTGCKKDSGYGSQGMLRIDQVSKTFL